MTAPCYGVWGNHPLIILKTGNRSFTFHLINQLFNCVIASISKTRRENSWIQKPALVVTVMGLMGAMVSATREEEKSCLAACKQSSKILCEAQTSLSMQADAHWLLHGGHYHGVVAGSWGSKYRFFPKLSFPLGRCWQNPTDSAHLSDTVKTLLAQLARRHNALCVTAREAQPALSSAVHFIGFHCLWQRDSAMSH